MDSFFPAREADHDCGGENCPVCAQTAAARSLTEAAVSPSSGVFSRLFAAQYARRGASEGRDGLRRLSLAELMVKLTC
ncbi:MAG: hypothetical protein LBL05_06705 [Synergistaceae bacterium]|jgi:hypothetical protein|nr:hypothetical protein [Synergistaceae bacterium]